MLLPLHVACVSPTLQLLRGEYQRHDEVVIVRRVENPSLVGASVSELVSVGRADSLSTGFLYELF